MAKKLSETVIISEELLKLHSSISNNVSVNKVFPFVILAQSYYIKRILGTALLEELQEQVETGSLTPLNKALIIKVAPVLALYTEYLATRSLAYSVTEKGISKEHSENSESIPERELGEFQLDIRNRAQMAEELLIEYLCKCQDNYPLWFPANECKCDKYMPTDGTNERSTTDLIYFPYVDRSCGKCK